MKTLTHILFAFLMLCIASCKNDDPYVMFEVDSVDVNQSVADKNRLKTDIEFVSIAYNDLFGTNISQNELEDIITSYKSFGDKSLVIEMIIRKFIATNNSNIPSIQRTSKENVEVFVQDTYEKIFNRTPNAMEKWHMTEYIFNDEEISADMVYFALMTSNEYRYY